MDTLHSDLFANETWPPGFKYTGSLIGVADEEVLIARFAGMPFKEFQFQGFLGKRRVVSFGWRYDFNGGGLSKADPIPEFLHPLRRAAATFADMDEHLLQQVLLTEYRPGAAIGWHRDRSVFAEVIGISLLSPCVFRFRRRQENNWQRASLRVEPRSAYLLQGAARNEWEHSIPGVDALRYSVTFRRLADAAAG